MFRSALNASLPISPGEHAPKEKVWDMGRCGSNYLEDI